jgi:hypothetical protein
MIAGTCLRSVEKTRQRQRQRREKEKKEGQAHFSKTRFSVCFGFFAEVECPADPFFAFFVRPSVCEIRDGKEDG